MRFRLLSYNIHKGIGGVDRRYDLDRVIQAIAHYQPDVAFLQEVDEGVPRSRRHQQCQELALALGFSHQLFQSNVTLKEGSYGNAILSHFPLDNRHDVELTVPLKKRRRGLATHCHVHRNGHTRTVRLINVHLGLAGYERAIQTRRIVSSNPVTGANRATPLIVGGDFNDMWNQLGPKLLLPQGFHPVVGAHKTFPAAYPVSTLDRIFYRGKMRLHHAYTGATQVAQVASDHLPVIADFELF
ncbi:MAG: endonuclease/exonuclease/phosphatase family protein [Pirellulaceae bacterium]